MLKAATIWDGEIDQVLVKDDEGGVWTPDEETQKEIQDSKTPSDLAIAICKESPMRGEWSQ